MSGIPLVALGDLCDVNIGRTPAREKREYWGVGAPWLSIADMNQGRALSKTKEQITERAIAETNMRAAPAGTVLLSFKLSIGKVGIASTPLFTNEAIAALPIRDSLKLSPEFLYWALQSIDLTVGQDRAAMGLTLNKAKLLTLKVPLPPLAEQRRIAAILDQAETLRAQRRATIAQLDSLGQAIFLEMFGDPVAEQWQWGTLVDIADPRDGAIRTGPFGSQLLHSEFVEEGVAVLGIDNAVANEFRWSERRFISEAKYLSLKRYTVHPGDVLITIMGTCGRCAVVPDHIPLAINTKHLCCITLNPEKCLPAFLHAYFLRHPAARKHLDQTAKGAIMSGLNMGTLKTMPVPLAPLELQQTFVRRIESVDHLRSAHRTALAHLDELFASLQHRAFAGTL